MEVNCDEMLPGVMKFICYGMKKQDNYLFRLSNKLFE